MPLLKPPGGPRAHLTRPGTSLHACSRRRGDGGSATQSHGPHPRQACAPSPCYERPLPPGALAQRLPTHAGLFLAPPPRDPFAHSIRDVRQPIRARRLGEWLNTIGSTYMGTPVMNSSAFLHAAEAEPPSYVTRSPAGQAGHAEWQGSAGRRVKGGGGRLRPSPSEPEGHRRDHEEVGSHSSPRPEFMTKPHGFASGLAVVWQ